MRLITFYRQELDNRWLSASALRSISSVSRSYELPSSLWHPNICRTKRRAPIRAKQSRDETITKPSWYSSIQSYRPHTNQTRQPELVLLSASSMIIFSALNRWWPQQTNSDVQHRQHLFVCNSCPHIYTSLCDVIMHSFDMGSKFRDPRLGMHPCSEIIKKSEMSYVRYGCKS